MTVKIFRRGSARCIGLLSAFITILLCLYYISMGQPSNIQPKEPIASLFVGSSGGSGASAVGPGNNLVAENGADNTVPQQLRIYGSKVRHGNNEDEHAPPTALRQHQLMAKSAVNGPRQNTVGGDAVDYGAAAAGSIGVDGSFGSANMYVNNPQWGDKCYILEESDTNITAQDEYAKFDFQPEWVRTKEYWDRGFEERFEAQKKDKQRPPLKVIVVPHSHNDPGWLKTFLNYFQSDSRQILNLMVTKMQEYTDMTFIWSEISFLQLWWDQAHPTKQRALKRLINSGRLEITTGGWVMTDEANVHLYAMLDQLIEGHQWLKNNLNVTPTVGWSIDPFGHGSTVPYLLSGSNFEGAIIQRIHYAWKQWFARHQKGDFMWTPYWNSHGGATDKQHRKGSLLTHNMPFDIYSIKGSCGPHPFICLNFDFRKIPGEYTEYSIKAQFITDENVEEKAQLLLEQYSRTASLFPHNVALIPVGDDFRYNKEREVDQQYTNYKKLIDHIMANKRLYNVDISFGTPKDYFNEIKKRTAEFPTFKGDFFVYSDIFSEGRPAYWSGYFTTRPSYKILSADLEQNLRAGEILFTLAYNTARQRHHENAIKIFEKNYEKMIHARRNLGLFQHHDAITGTSKAAVMRDYGMRLFESIQDVVRMQQSAIELLIQNGTERHNFLLSELERDNFSKLPRKTPIPLATSSPNSDFSIEFTSSSADGKSANFVVFNSLTHKRVEALTIRTTTPYVKILNDAGQELRNVQINPVWNISDPYELGMNMMGSATTARIRISKRQYEVMFLAELDPLSLTSYTVAVDEVNAKRLMSTIYCDECTDQLDGSTTETPIVKEEFVVKSKPPGDIQLENNFMRLLFDEKTGFLKTNTRKGLNQQLLNPMQCAIKFAAYRSAQFHSGAYLFKTDPEQSEAEKDVLEQYEDKRIIITSGLIASDVTVIYGPFLAHTVRIFNTKTHLDAAIYFENDIDFEPPPKNRETELFMRFITDIDNIAPVNKDTLKDGDTIPELPEFFTDQNGFQFHRRVKVPSIGIEGNYFPITTAAFMQDDKVRFSLLTTHAQGAASYEPGQLEVMLDRRTLYDDYRGMGEGIVDSRLTRHKFWVVIEDMPVVTKPKKYQVPSLLTNYLANGLRYPPTIYFVENFENPPQLKNKALLLDNGAWPCDVHLINFRTLSEEQLQLFPSSSALVVLQRQGFDCSVNNRQDIDLLVGVCPFQHQGLGNVNFNKLHLSSLETTSLTGILPGHRRKQLKSFNDIIIEPMELLTFNVTFKT
ncbi:alpha-mannosidase 2 [Musca domestica]|uniref:Alpha-mannosidase n=1 Tax=Musca domestica TaxID=7370 RepID=A0ABM3UKJ2_MUSDO|nr:alpha-mannosidase 2 [Musca domestica]